MRGVERSSASRLRQAPVSTHRQGNLHREVQHIIIQPAPPTSCAALRLHMEN